jgi:hypothetical protein
MARREFEMSGAVDNDLPPSHVVEHPVSGVPILLRNPALTVIEPTRAGVVCSDAESFAAAVLALEGENKLVELRDSAEFHYKDALAGRTLRAVGFALTASPTAFILCLEKGQSFAQKALLKFVAQHPECLTPQHPQAAAVLENLSNIEIKGSSNFKSVHTRGGISFSAERQSASVGMDIPEFWTACSPLYAGHVEFETTLRLEIVEPGLDDDGKVKGELAFKFELWTPDALEVKDAAMVDAQVRMGKLLPA